MILYVFIIWSLTTIDRYIINLMEDNMTSKQRAYLKSLAMKIDPIYNIGKGSISPELVQGVRDALEARELIKIGVLQNCMDDPKELANVLAERTRSQVVQVIGKKIVLYKESKNHKRIELPKAGK